MSNARLQAIVGVVAMAVVLVVYFALIGIRAFALFSSDSIVAIAMGVAMLVLPLIGAWALGREIVFGYSATKLTDRLADEHELPEELVVPGENALATSGVRVRPRREEAAAAFPTYRQAVEANPEDWRVWVRLGLIYDAAGDRRRARASLRQAILVEKKGK